MDFSNKLTITQGRRNQQEAAETPQSFTVSNGITQTEDSGNLQRASRPQRMAGEMGERALTLMNDPIEKQRTDMWMAAFGQSNQGADWNMAKMNGGVPM